MKNKINYQEEPLKSLEKMHNNKYYRNHAFDNELHYAYIASFMLIAFLIAVLVSLLLKS